MDIVLFYSRLVVVIVIVVFSMLYSLRRSAWHGYQWCVRRVIFHWLSETKEVENVFLTHRWSLGIGHVTVGRAVVFVASAIIDLPTRPPRDFQFFMCHILNVQTL